MHNRSHAHVEKNTLTSFVSCNAYLRSNIEDCDHIRNIIQRVKNMNALLFDIRILFLPGILIRIKKKNETIPHPASRQFLYVRDRMDPREYHLQKARFVVANEHSLGMDTKAGIIPAQQSH